MANSEERMKEFTGESTKLFFAICYSPFAIHYSTVELLTDE